MKVLRLYDLINDKETIIICYRYPRTAVLRQMDAEKIENERRKRKRQIFVRKIKEAAISAIEIAVSIVAGLAFLHIISEKLLEIRGYEALGGEVIAAGFITFFTFYVFPAWAVLPFLFMIVSGLLSTVDSNLCAASSLVTDMSGGKELKKTKWAMIALLGVGILIANIPGMTVTHLFLFYGTLRASTLLPTVMTLKGVKFTPKGIQYGVISALAVGLPIFAYGTVLNSGPYKTLGSLATVLLGGIVGMIVTKAEVRHGKSAR